MSMRILLLHNPKAGREEHEREELLTTLRNAGHKVVYQSSRGMKRALKKKIDLVLAAGGDGTVGKIARRLVGRKIPLSVLPLGTANNLARMLGFHRSAKTLVAQLEHGEPDGFDVGVASGPWGKRYLFEGAGAGLFADCVKAPIRDGKKAASKAEVMKEHVAELRRRLS